MLYNKKTLEKAILILQQRGKSSVCPLGEIDHNYFLLQIQTNLWWLISLIICYLIHFNISTTDFLDMFLHVSHLHDTWYMHVYSI